MLQNSMVAGIDLIAESMYTFLEMNDVLSNEQKGCRRKTRGTKDQLLIERQIY